MKELDYQLECDEKLGICGLSPGEKIKEKKKIELYIFTHPLCPECWAFEPVLKKLLLEYGHYFTVRYFVSTHLDLWNMNETRYKKEQKNLAHLYEKTGSRSGMSCDGDVWLEVPIHSPHAPSIAIKAAEMQGRQLSVQYLRRLRELLFLHKKNITDEEVLIECAKDTDLDVELFKKDFHSNCALKALQCDMKTTLEMGVDKSPTFIFFNDIVEDGGLKISGLYSYDIYVAILQEMLGEKPIPKKAVNLLEFMKRFKFVATKEVEVVFDWKEREAISQLKKLVLQRKIEQVPVKHGTFWRYIEPASP